MKKLLLTIVSLLFIVVLHASVLDAKITIHTTNMKVSEILFKIEAIAGVSFSFQSSLFKTNKTYSLAENNVPLRSVLDKILYPEGVEYYAVGNQIVLYKKKSSQNASPKNNTVSTTSHKNVTTPKPLTKAKAVSEKHNTVVEKPILTKDTVWVEKIVHDTVEVVKTDTVVQEKIIYKEVDCIETESTVSVQNKAKYFISAGIDAGAFVAKSQWEPEKYHNSVTIAESFLSSKSFHFSCGILYDKLNVQAGIETSHYSSDYAINADYRLVDSSCIISYDIIDSLEITIEYERRIINGDTIFVERKRDTTHHLDIVAQYKKDSLLLDEEYRNNYFEALFPFEISYSVEINKNIDLHFGGGVAFGIVLKAKGNIFKNNDKEPLKGLSAYTISRYSISPSVQSKIIFKNQNNFGYFAKAKASMQFVSDITNYTSQSRFKWTVGAGLIYYIY